MDRFRALVLCLASADRLGGRAQIVDGQTVVLYDCMYWSDACSEGLLAHYPETRITVRACRQSLSGFNVTFRCARNGGREAAWYLVIGLVLACCAYALARPPWWVAYARILHI